MTSNESAISAAIERIRSQQFSNRTLLRRVRRGKKISINVRNVALEADLHHTTIYRATDRSLALIVRAKTNPQPDTAVLRAEIKTLRVKNALLEKTVKQLATKAAYHAFAHEKVMRELRRDKKREARIRKASFFAD